VTRIRLAYVHAFLDRHGRSRYYFRRRGRRIPLPGLPGSAEFMTAYTSALEAAPKATMEIGSARTIAGSVNAMIVGYLGSAAYTRLAAASQRQYRRILEDLRRQHGDRSIAALERRHVTLLLEAKANAPAAARDLLRCLRLLVRHAIELGVRQDDPTIGIRVKMPKTDGFRTWTEDDIAAFEAAYPIGTKPRLALALLLGTALRAGDVVRVGRSHLRNGAIAGIVQQKTGTLLPPIPISTDLSAAINAAAPSEHVVFLVNELGRSFTAKGFGKWFTKQCERIGLNGLSPHGLRKAACRRLAEAGCSANEIAAISGHKSLNEVARYTRAADQARMARNAMTRMKQQHELANPATISGKPGKKPRRNGHNLQ
jgi:integrase